jgi:hypothetical protein
MQRFSQLRRPLLAAFAALCAAGMSFFPLASSRLLAQDQPKPATAEQAAGSTDPVLVVTVASLNKLMQDVNYISALMGQPQAGGMFTMMAGSFTQGLDTSRPIGIIVPMVDGAPEPIGVLPTADVELMLKRLEGQIGPADKLDDGTLVVAAGPALVYIRQVGRWAVIARNRELIDLVPADPMSLMVGMGDNYDIAMRLAIQEIPLGLREMVVDQLSQGFEQAMAQQSGNSEQMAELSKAQLDQLNTLIREADELMFGINVNPSKRVLSIDTEFKAASGTALSEMYAGQQPIPSKFTAVLKGDPAFRYHAAASVGPKVIESTTASIDMIMTSVQKALDDQDRIGEDVKAEIEEMLGGLLDLFGKTMAEGKYDVGVVGMAGDNMFKIAGGMFVHDGDEIAAWVQKLDKKLSQLPDAPKFNFNESTYNGVTMHSVVIDIPARAAESRRLLGEKAVLTLGTAPQAVYFAFGQGSEVAMKALIDSADADAGDLADRPLGQMRVKLLPILRLAQSMKPTDPVAAIIDAVAVGAESDYVSVVANVIENGQSNNIEIGEGVLKAIGAVIREQQNAQMRQLQRGGQF